MNYNKNHSKSSLPSTKFDITGSYRLYIPTGYCALPCWVLCYITGLYSTVI